MLLLSNMVLNTGTVAFFRSFAVFDHSAVSLTHKNCWLIFCFAKSLTGKCNAKVLRLKVAKLRLNFGILSQNCDWVFSLISRPAKATEFIHAEATIN